MFTILESVSGFVVVFLFIFLLLNQVFVYGEILLAKYLRWSSEGVISLKPKLSYHLDKSEYEGAFQDSGYRSGEFGGQLYSTLETKNKYSGLYWSEFNKWFKANHKPSTADKLRKLTTGVGLSMTSYFTILLSALVIFIVMTANPTEFLGQAEWSFHLACTTLLGWVYNIGTFLTPLIVLGGALLAIHLGIRYTCRTAVKVSKVLESVKKHEKDFHNK